MQGVFPSTKSLTKGGIITLILAIVLSWSGLIIVQPAEVDRPIYIMVNIISILLCWVIVSYIIERSSIYKVLGIIGIIFTAILAEWYIDIQKNPFTVPLIILFWLGVAYLILPQFFKKYQVAILGVYGLVISYYFFLFISTPDISVDHRLDFVSYMMIPIPVFTGLWIYEQWRWLKTLQADKAKAELTLLKSQVNPHFFFNTLNNLYGLVVEKSDRAPDVVLKLSDMMRYTIYEGKEEEVSLMDEVQYLNAYIELHKIRYQHNVDIQFVQHIEQEVRVAPLLFINLLENAFKHGMESKTSDGYIHINMSVKEKQIKFKIKNNYEPKETEQSSGIGIDNLKKRLEHIYPNRHTLNIQMTANTYAASLQIDLRP